MHWICCSLMQNPSRPARLRLVPRNKNAGNAFNRADRQETAADISVVKKLLADKEPAFPRKWASGSRALVRDSASRQIIAPQMHGSKGM